MMFSNLGRHPGTTLIDMKPILKNIRETLSINNHDIPRFRT